MVSRTPTAFRRPNGSLPWPRGSTSTVGNAQIRTHLGLKDRTHLRERYLTPALADGLIEPTLPDKPHSRLQQYRLTEKGRALLVALRKEGTLP
jgi:hypothetical protein